MYDNGLNQLEFVGRSGEPPYASFQYDNNGNMTSQYIEGTDTIQFEYDYENRLTRILYPGGGLTKFVYDALGRRLRTIEKDRWLTVISKRQYIYDGLDLIAELDKDGVLVASYTHGPGIDDPINVRLGGETGADFFYHKNHQGSITEITDINGNIAKMYKYDAFGRKYFESGPPLVDEFAYTGRELHDRTGLYYYRNRFYNPQLGRFMTQDPIGIAGGINLYGYVGSTPTGYNDPLGLWMEKIFDDPVERGAVDPKHPPVTMDQFIRYAQGKSLDDLQHEMDRESRGTRSAEGPSGTHRYVYNPRNPNEVIDMRHMLVVGPQGEIAGLLIEILQVGNESSFHAQDFLSNALGDDFLNGGHYDPMKPFAPQLKQYFFGGPQ